MQKNGKHELLKTMGAGTFFICGLKMKKKNKNIHLVPYIMYREKYTLVILV